MNILPHIEHRRRPFSLFFTLTPRRNRQTHWITNGCGAEYVLQRRIESIAAKISNNQHKIFKIVSQWLENVLIAKQENSKL